MTATTHSSRRDVRLRREVIIVAIAIMGTALVSTHIWLMTAHTIAPPGLRILDFLWTTLSWLKV